MKCSLAFMIGRMAQRAKIERSEIILELLISNFCARGSKVEM